MPKGDMRSTLDHLVGVVLIDQYLAMRAILVQLRHSEPELKKILDVLERSLPS
jgi:hypothetical protein